MQFILRTSLAFLLLLCGLWASAQTTYTWNGSVSSDYAVADNWTPSRGTPATTDILVIGGTTTLSNVPTQTIGGLTISTGANVTLNPASMSNTLTIDDGTSTDLVIDGALTFGFFQQVKLGAGASATIAGSLTVTNAGAVFTVEADASVVASGIVSGDNKIVVNGTYECTAIGLPVISWGATGLFIMSGNPASISTGLGQNFANILWNSTTQSTDFALTSFGTISELRVQNANGKRVILSDAGGSRTMTKLSIANGATVVVGAAATAFTLTVTDVSLGSATLIVSDGTAGVATLATNKMNSSSGTGALVIANNTGSAALSVTGTGSVFTAGITSPGAGIGSIVYDGTSVQTVALSTIASTVHIGNSNTVGITAANYPAGCPLDLYSDAGYTKIAGTATIGDVTNNDTDGIGATVEFNGTSQQAPTFGTIGATKFTIYNNNNGGLSLSDFPSGCRLQNASGKSSKVGAATASFDAIVGTGTVEFNGASAQGVSIGGTLPAGTVKINNASGVTFSPVIDMPASSTLTITQGIVTGINSYDATANLVYNGSTLYTAGSEIATGLESISLQNSAGVNLGSSAVLAVVSSLNMSSGSNVSGQPLSLTNATLTGGNLDMSTNTFTVVSGGTFASSNAFIYNGSLIRDIPSGAATYTFPVGTASGDRSVTINFTSLTNGGTLTCAFISTAPGTGGLPKTVGGIQLTSMGTGYWSVVAGGGLAIFSYNITVNAVGFAGLLDYTSARLLKRDNSSSNWTTPGTYEPSSMADFGMTGRTTFSEFGIGVAAGAFPVELTSFDATEAGNVNVLDWITASEQNSAYFEVDRSANGANGWSAIGRVEAAGNSESLHAYTFADLNPLKAAHYRLRMVDTDGSVAMSEIRSVTRAVFADNVSVGPVPVSDVLTISVSTTKNEVAVLRVFSATGDQVFSSSLELGTGQAAAIDLSKLAAGVYRVVISGAISYEKTIIKL